MYGHISVQADDIFYTTHAIVSSDAESMNWTFEQKWVVGSGLQMCFSLSLAMNAVVIKKTSTESFWAFVHSGLI